MPQNAARRRLREAQGDAPSQMVGSVEDARKKWTGIDEQGRDPKNVTWVGVGRCWGPWPKSQRGKGLVHFPFLFSSVGRRGPSPQHCLLAVPVMTVPRAGSSGNSFVECIAPLASCRGHQSDVAWPTWPRTRRSETRVSGEMPWHPHWWNRLHLSR